MSQLTTHILDTSLGKPVPGIAIQLEQFTLNKWQSIANGKTNSDGRIADLLPKDTVLPLGTYRLIFETASYFSNQKIKSFYPSVTIEFEISDATHYHVPLLLNPFGAEHT